MEGPLSSMWGGVNQKRKWTDKKDNQMIFKFMIIILMIVAVMHLISIGDSLEDIKSMMNIIRGQLHRRECREIEKCRLMKKESNISSNS